MRWLKATKSLSSGTYVPALFLRLRVRKEHKICSALPLLAACLQHVLGPNLDQTLTLCCRQLSILALFYPASNSSLSVPFRFGAFSPKFRPARKARNPKTQEELNVPASTVPNFSASKAFKEKVGQAHNGAA